MAEEIKKQVAELVEMFKEYKSIKEAEGKIDSQDLLAALQGNDIGGRMFRYTLGSLTEVARDLVQLGDDLEELLTHPDRNGSEAAVNNRLSAILPLIVDQAANMEQIIADIKTFN